MSSNAVVWFTPCLAGVVWLGASHPRALPVLLLGGVALGCLLLRRPVLLLVAAALLASSVSATAWAGLEPIASGPFQGTATLVGDPARSFRGQVRADVRLPDGSRVEAIAHEGAGALLLERAAGERVRLRGELEPPPDDAPWSVPRHLRGRLVVEEVQGWTAGHVLSRLANGLRRTLVHGAGGLSEERRALYTGLLLGDDREQGEEDTDAFRAAGLGHLLAVSGQNVAYVLLVVQPLVQRLGPRSRLLAVASVLVLFACVTRFEPSVLRAVTMAGVAAVASWSGRTTAGVQVLALAVAVLVLVDPLLVHALGFRLSVAASAGILLLAPPIRDRLPGPRWLAEGVAVTLAAQLAVAPLLLPTFGSMPVASLPANVLAGPASGPVAAWGITGGLVAGLVPAGLASLLHLPTSVLLWWIDAVAHLAVRVPTGELEATHLLLLAPAVAALLVARTRRVRLFAATVAALVLLHPSVALRGPKPLEVALGDGAALVREDGAAVLVVDGRANPGPLLEGLRREGAHHLDLVVDRTGGAGAVLDVLHERYPRVVVAGPEGSGAEHEVAVATVLSVGALDVEVRPSGATLSVEVPSQAADGPGPAVPS